MTKITQHLWFEKDMAAALRLYVSLIPGSAVTGGAILDADTRSGPAGSVRTAEFSLGDQRYRAIEAGPLDPFNRSFSIMATCEDQVEVDHLWNILGEGGAHGECGWLTDRWGLSWQIVPKRFFELMADPDPGRARRAAAAMLKMTRLDIAALEAAVAE